MVAAFKADRRIQNVETEELDGNFSDSIESLTEIGHNINADAGEELDSVAEESDEDSDEETEEQSSQHVHDYDDSEINHDIALAIYQRVSCFTRTLQLVVDTYDKDVSSNFKTALSKANKLVKNLPN